MKQELLLGSGINNLKQIKLPADQSWEFENLITLDINPDRNPDIVWDLNNIPYPFADNIFDEVHAYHVLEHLGTQGDVKSFFGFFDEMYRLLKPNGRFYAIVPYWKSDWVFGDPGHTRVIHPNMLGFLKQSFYEGVGQSPSSDYRYIYKSSFKVLEMNYTEDPNNGVFGFILEKEPI